MRSHPTAEEQSRGSENEQEAKHVAIGWVEKIEEQYRKTREHAETYPYVWASYILVYGTLGAWLTYRWRTLRKTEDRIRALQEQLRKKYEDTSTSADVAGRSVKYGSPKPNPPSAHKDDE
ncbi:hypothetical protein C2S52_012888 [Perilla frutescens var. hirtella]|nr:hypothetical protein C2S51_015245 [Perilla frutescens var. frutescens]KAH6775327.1 hypothetical protein C2S52_012888 [Perilla frutescens var. hirtella]